MITFDNPSYPDYLRYFMYQDQSAQGQIANQGQAKRGYEGSALGGGDGLKTEQTAPPWDQMRARVGGKMEGLSQSISNLSSALAPVLEQTGKNTPVPNGYTNRVEVAQPTHDSPVMEFMRNTERQIDNLRLQIDFLTRGLPFDTAPF